MAEKKKKGLTIDECVKKAGMYISKYGMCLLLFDVKGSKDFPDKRQLIEKLLVMMKDLNAEFGDYFPENDLAVESRKEKGFCCLLGDASWAGINNAEIIPKIIEYQENKYSDIPVYWGVAKDGYDKEGVALAR